MRDLPQAAVFVYITDLEGLGSAVLLAMAAGAPVLASRVGGLPEIVDDGISGLLTSNEPPAIAKQIQRLLADRPLALRLAALRPVAASKKEFSLDRMVNDTLRVYERIRRLIEAALAALAGLLISSFLNVSASIVCRAISRWFGRRYPSARSARSPSPGSITFPC